VPQIITVLWCTAIYMYTCPCSNIYYTFSKTWSTHGKCYWRTNLYRLSFIVHY